MLQNMFLDGFFGTLRRTAVRLYMQTDCDTTELLPVISAFRLFDNNDNLIHIKTVVFLLKL